MNEIVYNYAEENGIVHRPKYTMRDGKTLLFCGASHYAEPSDYIGCMQTVFETSRAVSCLGCLAHGG